MAPTLASTDFRHVLVPRDLGEGYFFWLKYVFISVFCSLFLVLIIRIIYWYNIYDREQRQWVSWYHWSNRQREERMERWALAQQQQQQQHARAQQHQRTLRWTAWERQQNGNTRPNMRTVPVAHPQPAVLRMNIVTPPPPQPPPPPPVNLMFVMVNVPDTDNDDGVPRGEARNARAPGSPTPTNQYRREGITRTNEGSERGHHQRTPSRASSRNQTRTDTRSDREHQRTPSRTQSRNQSRTESSWRAIDEAPPAYRP